jgi:hypothetical protein
MVRRGLIPGGKRGDRPGDALFGLADDLRGDHHGHDILLCATSGVVQPTCSNVLIDEDRIAVRVYRDETGRPGGTLVSLLLQTYALCLQLPLQLADIREHGEGLGVTIPTRIERENVFLEHPLKEAYDVIPVFEDQPVL